MLIKDHQVLLVKHTYLEHWYLPGGGVKKQETLEAAARREAREEVGAELGEMSLFGAYSNFSEHKSDHVILFICQDFSVAGKPGYEIEAFAFFPFNAIPEDTSPATRRRLREYLEQQSSVLGAW